MKSCTDLRIISVTFLCLQTPNLLWLVINPLLAIGWTFKVNAFLAHMSCTRWKLPVYVYFVVAVLFGFCFWQRTHLARYIHYKQYLLFLSTEEQQHRIQIPLILPNMRPSKVDKQEAYSVSWVSWTESKRVGFRVVNSRWGGNWAGFGRQEGLEQLEAWDWNLRLWQEWEVEQGLRPAIKSWTDYLMQQNSTGLQ